jgi:hypothetical protein
VKGKTNLRVVVAGQTVPNPNSQWEKWCLRHELGPIDDPNDWVHWALNNGIEVDQTNIDLICHLTDGHPLLTHTYLGKVPAWKVSHEQQAR